MSSKTNTGTPLIDMRDICISFGGVHAVDHVSVDLYPGEVVGLLGHNGAGKSTLIKILSGAYKMDSGEIYVNGERADIRSPRDARRYNIETIYQTLALADNLDAASNLFLGRELTSPLGLVDDDAMESEARKIMARLNPNFQKFKDPTQMVSELITQLKAEGIGIFLISHDIHDVMELCDRASVMKNGKLVGTVDVADVTDDDLLSMIILGKQPGKAA